MVSFLLSNIDNKRGKNITKTLFKRLKNRFFFILSTSMQEVTALRGAGFAGRLSRTTKIDDARM